MKRISIVDDEANIGRSLRLILEREGYEVVVFGSASELRSGRDCASDLYLLDVRLPDATGIDVLRFLRESDDPAPVVMISGHGTIRDAVEATQAGAFDFLEKPLSRDRILLVIKNALEKYDLERQNLRFRELVGEETRMVGRSSAFQRVVGEATRVAGSDTSVLLAGESGTGKELLAAHIHHSSSVSSGPFVKVNCAAIPTELIESELFGHEKGAFTGATTMRRGKFELAHGGSILLDEVGDLEEAAQAKLLRVLEDGELQRLGGERTLHVAVRVISATHRDLEALISAGSFRKDLYYRLSVVPIRVPALRERTEDIPDLARHFLGQFCKRNNFRPKTIDDTVFPVLGRYPWPGNARELRNTMERMAILSEGDRISVESVPLEIRQADSGSRGSRLHEIRDSAERDRILRALEETHWNVSGAARALGIERTNLHKRMRALGLDRDAKP